MNISTATPMDSFEENRIQIMAYLAGELSPEEIAALSAALRESPELQEEFVELTKQHVLLGEIGEATAGESPATLAPEPTPPSKPSPFTTNLHMALRRHARNAIAAFVFIGLLVSGFALFRNQNASVSEKEKFSIPEVIDVAVPSTPSVPQGSQTLEAGLIQIELPNGVKLVFEGPVNYQFNSAFEMMLVSGKVTAKVPPSGHGFTVVTPNARVVDLGTEFGVEVRADDSTYVAVFTGKIQIYPRYDFDPLKTGRPLVQGEAGLVPPEATVVLTADYQPERFVRELSQTRVPIPLFNTGTGLKPGQLDPHWKIVALSSNRNFTPQQAFFVRNVPAIEPDLPWGANWISVTKDLSIAPPGKYTFRTLVDLTGFDPETALIVARVCADDGVSDICINGRSTGEDVPYRRNSGRRSHGEVTLRGAFREGINEIDFVVENVPAQGLNTMLLSVEWTGTAAKVK